MNKEIDIKDMAPVKASERHVILDALRGFALLGICFANFPEFSLYTFQKPEITEAMPTAEIDKVIRFLQYLSWMVSSTPYSHCCSVSDFQSLSATRPKRERTDSVSFTGG